MTRLAIMVCPVHNFKAVSYGNKRLTSSKCCGSWTVIQSWEVDPHRLVKDVKEEAGVKLIEDPHPRCEHEWMSLGLTAICEPPIAHFACFKCETFKDVQDPGGEVGRAYGDKDAKEEVWFKKFWAHGPWDWTEERARIGK